MAELFPTTLNMSFEKINGNIVLSPNFKAQNLSDVMQLFL